MLSSPAGPQGPAARITARFYQREAAAGAAQKPAGQGDTDAAGGLFGGGFRTDPNAPVDIEAETLDVNDATKLAVFRGEVRAVQGDTVIRTPEMTAHYAGRRGSAPLGPAPSGRPARRLSSRASRRAARSSSPPRTARPPLATGPISTSRPIPLRSAGRSC